MPQLQFHVTTTEPQVENDFLRSKGPLLAAAANKGYRVACTGMRGSLPAAAGDTVTLQLPAAGEEGVSTDAFVSTTLSRLCTATNGTVVTAVAGQGVVPVAAFVDACNKDEPVSIPLTYGAYSEQAGVLVASRIKFLSDDGSEAPAAPRAVRDSELELKTQRAEEAMVSMWQQSCDLRAQILTYQHMPALSKPLVNAPVGFRTTEGALGADDSRCPHLNATGYEPTFSLLSKRTAYSPDQLECMLKAAVGVECGQIEEDVATFLEECASPSQASLRYAHVGAGAIRNIGNWAVCYKSDGRTASDGNGGVNFVEAEHWRDQLPEDLFCGDDCDGSAMLIVSVARQLGIGHCDDDEADPVSAERPFSLAVKNSLWHHVVGLGVLGAICGEGDGVHDANEGVVHTDIDNTKPQAGHACAIAVPAAGLLRACAASDACDYEALRQPSESAAGAGTAAGSFGPLAKDGDARRSLAQVRANALFPARRVAQLGADAPFVSEDGTVSAAAYMESYAAGAYTIPLEGTTLAPTAPMYEGDPAKKAVLLRREKTMDADKAAIGASIGRTILNLPHMRADGAHSFYAQFVEFVTFGSLFTDPGAQKHGIACGHYVFHSPPGEQGAAVRTGVSPRQLTVGEYCMAQICRLSRQQAADLEWGIRACAPHRMPPPAAGMSLSSWEEANVQLATTWLQELQADMDERRDKQGQDQTDAAADKRFPVELHLTPAALARNPRSVKHLLQRVRDVCHDAVVDTMELHGGAKAAVIAAFVA